MTTFNIVMGTICIALLVTSRFVPKEMTWADLRKGRKGGKKKQARKPRNR